MSWTTDDEEEPFFVHSSTLGASMRSSNCTEMRTVCIPRVSATSPSSYDASPPVTEASTMLPSTEGVSSQCTGVIAVVLSKKSSSLFDAIEWRWGAFYSRFPYGGISQWTISYRSTTLSKLQRKIPDCLAMLQQSHDMYRVGIIQQHH
jgi:hypothetical protein